MQIQFFLNDRKIQTKIMPGDMLLDLLRSLGMKSVKCGCDTGNCGLCTVWLDDRPVLSCSVPAARVDGHRITTLEGVQDQAAEFADYLAGEGADQCGFCSPGFIMNVLALKKENPNPSPDDIRAYLAGNLCRCTGYQSQQRALEKYFRPSQGGLNS